MKDSCEGEPDPEACYDALEFQNPADVYTVGADGDDFRRLTSAPGYDGDPDWSPDGERIALARDDGVYLMKADGSGLELLRAGNLSNPVWSPDGEAVAAEDSYNEIVVIDVEDGTLTNLTKRQGPDLPQPGHRTGSGSLSSPTPTACAPASALPTSAGRSG
jgi:Tol biopolymer transport system component